MAIRSFSVGPQKGLEHAEATDLPNIVAISGSNGAGKSSLLNLLWTYRSTLAEPDTQVLRVGADRSWRSGALTNVASISAVDDYEKVLSSDILPHFQYGAPGGHNWLSGQMRGGSDTDDSQAFVKSSIVRVNSRFEKHVANIYREQGNKIDPNTVSDLLQPLRDLIGVLLPHLDFVGIDDVNPDDIRVLFRPAGANSATSTAFDIDDLSSGEKAAISLFLPFVERKSKQLATMSDHESSLADGEDHVIPLTLLLDEPEIHLHPSLQLNMLNYMRTLAESGEAQFIFTTHSPTMLDALEPKELYLLSPASLAPDNQISPVSLDVEKLEIAREITGATHLLTRSKPIVFVEGEPDNDSTASDSRLIKLLLPETQHWSIVAFSGKSQVIRAVSNMMATNLHLPGTPVFGLVDDDQTGSEYDERIVSWPVAMVENLLLDPIVIADLLTPYTSITDRDEASIKSALSNIAAAQADDEVRLRVQSSLPTTTIRPAGADAESILASVGSQADILSGKLSKQDLAEVIDGAKLDVKKIVEEGRELEAFRGKKVLRTLYDQLQVSKAGLGWNSFVTELARRAPKVGGARLTKLTAPAIQRISLFLPEALDAALEKVSSLDGANELRSECGQARASWLAGTTNGSERTRLRSEVFAMGRLARSNGLSEEASLITSLAAQIGTKE